MFIEMLKSKIHRAVVCQTDLNYTGSITVDRLLLDAAAILEYEKIQVVDVDNGSRFETYVIAAEKGSGMICLNGAAARLANVGDKIILMAYAQLAPDELAAHHPKVVLVDENNHIQKVAIYEDNGELSEAQ